MVHAGLNGLRVSPFSDGEGYRRVPKVVEAKSLGASFDLRWLKTLLMKLDEMIGRPARLGKTRLSGPGTDRVLNCPVRTSARRRGIEALRRPALVFVAPTVLGVVSPTPS